MINYQLVNRISKTIKIPSILGGFFWGNLVRKSQVKTQPRLSGRQEYTDFLNFPSAEVMTVRIASRNLHSLHVRDPEIFWDQLFIPTEIEEVTSWQKNNPAEDVISY